MAWKKSTPMAIFGAKRCMAALAKMRINPPYHGYDDYLLAIPIVERWSDKSLASDGRVNFDTMTGPEIIRGVEDILRTGLRNKKGARRRR